MVPKTVAWSDPSQLPSQLSPFDPTAALLASLLKSPLHPCGDAKFRPMPEAIHLTGEVLRELG